jgi:cobalamin biosynthesis Co2+ chelatase CbiK
MYGKSVMPYQPNGIWKSPYNDEVWKASANGDQYRRAVYTHIKRTATFPAFTTFDVGTREVCSTRRINTNTPLQALNTLNDTTYIIAARHIAKSLDYNLPFEKNVSIIFNKMFYTEISQAKLSSLQTLYKTSLNHFTKNRKDAEKLMDSNNDNNQNITQAAWTVTLNALMNIDEWLNKN